MKLIKSLMTLAIAASSIIPSSIIPSSIMANAQDTYDYVKPTGADNFYHSYNTKEQRKP